VDMNLPFPSAHQHLSETSTSSVGQFDIALATHLSEAHHISVTAPHTTLDLQDPGLWKHSNPPSPKSDYVHGSTRTETVRTHET
jgi:hypothetical protein